MKKIVHCLSFCIGIIVLSSCAAPGIHVEKPLNDNTKRDAVEKRDILPIICDELQSFIATEYFDSKKKPKIRVHIRNISSNHYDGPLLAKFVYDNMRDDFEQQYQFMVVSSDDPSLDCVVDAHIIHTHHNNIEILSNVREPTGTIIYSTKKEYYPDTLSLQEYCASTPERVEKKHAGTRLLVKAVNKGRKVRENGKYYRDTKQYSSRYSSYSRTYYKRSSKDLYSSFYAAEHECVINGKRYTLDADDVFYNDIISPGTIQFTASFRNAKWDAVERRQQIGKKYSKTFYVDMMEHDDITVDITFLYDGHNQDIMVEAYGRKHFKVKRKGAIGTSYESITVLSR